MYKTPKMPKISVVKTNETPSLAVSGKNIFKEKSNNMFANTNNNEFTFSPRAEREREYQSGKKQTAQKNPFEKNMFQERDHHESISKNEMFARLGIRNPEAEQVADLSTVPNPTSQGAGMTLARTKKDAANALISNLETEIEKLKYKRDTYIADRQREQRERELAARQIVEEEEAQIILHKDVERMQQLTHPISSLEKPTLENVEALLRAHKEKMQNIERQYMDKKKHMILSSDDFMPHTSAVAGPTSTRDVEVIKLGKENKESYERPKTSYQRPKSSKAVHPLKNPWERNKKTPAERAQEIKDKKAQKKDYQRKFQNYLEDKRDEVENPKAASPVKKHFDVYAPTSPNPKRAISKNKWATENIVENADAKNQSQSPERQDYQEEQYRTSKSREEQYRTSKPPREEQYRTSGHREEQYRSSRPQGLDISLTKSDKGMKESYKSSVSPKRISSPGRGQSPTRSGKKNKGRSSSPGTKHRKTHEEEEREFTESEVKLLLWVFNIMRKDNSETVDKEDICDYVLKSPQILELYDVDPGNLRSNLYAFRTDQRDSMHFEEFLAFLQESRQAAQGGPEYTTEEEIKMTKSIMKKSGKFTAPAETKSPTRSPGRSARKLPKSENVCVLSDEALETIKEIYHDVDKYDDLIVKRLALIKRLREDVRIARILHKPAVHIVEIDKYLSMERLLRQIEEEETTAVADQKKSKEYISLNQFLKYFTNYETPDDLAEKMGEKTVSPKKSPRTMKAMEEDDQDVIEVNPKHMKFFKDKFDAQPKKRQAYAETIKFIDELRGADHYKVCRFDPGRRKAMKFDLPNENIEAVINRMENEAEKYISWDDFVQFFTRRGRPRRLMTTTYNVEEDMIKTGLASDPKDKGLQTGAKLVQNAQRDGYDSDPEFHTYSKDINYEFRLQNREEPKSGKELSPKRSAKSPGSPERSMRDQMQQIRFETHPSPGRKSPRDPEHERDRERERERDRKREQRERERERERRLEKEKGSSSPSRGRPQTAVERDWERSPMRNRSASFDDRREVEDEFPEEEEEDYYDERARRKTDGWVNRSQDGKFGAIYKDAVGLRYTVPDPFEFDTREKVRAKSIRERKVEEMVREKQLEEERMMKHTFRAKSVPGIVKTPLFDKLIHDQEQRRAIVKKNSIAITKMREAPFNFYLRDKDKPAKGEPPLNAEFGKSFKAQPIPAICQLTDVWQNMKEREEIDRKERVARLAQQNLLLASLPPRMAKHEKEKKEQELKSQINERNMERQKDRKTFVANEVPDFERLHKQFQEHLDRKRRNKRPTETKPFQFQESKKGVQRDYLDIENKYRKAARDDAKRDPFESVRKLKETKPKLQPHTTKKMVALADLRKKEREEKQRKAEQLEKEEEERKARYHKMKPLVQGSAAIVDSTTEKEERAKQIKEDVKKKFHEDQKNFEEKKRVIDEKVAKRPLLVEQEVERNKRVQMQAMKDLSKLNKIMKEAGVRDPKLYFNQDEKDKLEDAEYLEKRGFKELKSDY